MASWWNWLIGIALVSLLLIVIPISYSGSKDREKMIPMFDEYIKKYNKTYKNNGTEYETRFLHFVNSIQEIEQMNALSRGPEQYRARYGLTKLSDMSKTEYKDLHLSDERLLKSPTDYGRSWKQNHGNYYKYDVASRRKRAADFPLKFDWRTQGVIGPVKNQGLCGACWAFSTVGIIEAMNAIATGKLELLSVQEMIDCAGLGNKGCLGGDICNLIEWLIASKASIVKESQYPLRLTDGVCRYSKNSTGVKVTGFTCDSMVGVEDKMLEMISTHGPLAVAVNALTWQNYLGGVIQFNCGGSPAELNHAVEIVGYDLTTEVPYYIAKNSWGPEYGNSGYVKLAIGTNVCGLAHEVASVDVEIKKKVATV